jgi:hypothetical protein
VYLGNLAQPVELNEHVNTLCIPSLPWAPKGTMCYMTGKDEKVSEFS